MMGQVVGFPCSPARGGSVERRETEGGVRPPLRLASRAASPVYGGGSGPRIPSKNLEALVGAAGWARLPAAVIARFGGAAMDAEFAGEGRFEASWIGRLF